MNWSLSKLGTFSKCRRRFLYSYLQRRVTPTAPAAQRGVDKHAQIDGYFKTGVPLPADLASYEPYFHKLKSLSHKSEYQLAMHETWLPGKWEDATPWWKGILDLFVWTGNHAWVFDWKTGKIYPDHVDQKELYAIAVFVNHPEIESIEAWHIYIDLSKHSKTEYLRGQLPALIAKWNGKLIPYNQALASYDPAAPAETTESFFVTNPTYLCDYCPFSRNPCPH